MLVINYSFFHITLLLSFNFQSVIVCCYSQALEQESYYMIYYVVISTLNNDTTASWSELATSVLTVPFDPSLVQTLSISVTSRNMTCLNFAWQLPKVMGQYTVGFNVSWLKELCLVASV